MDKKVRIIIVFGSNINQRYHMENAENMITKLLGDGVVFSKRIWTKPIGLVSDMFLNRLAVGYTNYEIMKVERELKNIEYSLGSTNTERHNGIVKIDLDILLFDNQKYHEKDWERDYIKRLMKELSDKGDLTPL